MKKFSAMVMEKRKYWRVQCELPVRYSIINAKGAGDLPGSQESTILDIGFDGVAFPVDHPVNIYDVFDLEISLPEPPPVKVTGEIRRATKVEDAYLLGIHFLDIKDEDRERIKEYLLRKVSEASDETLKILDKFFKKR